MRYAIVSDIHGNFEAFQAVLGHAARNGGFGNIICLGDVVGYGPDPHECVQLLRKHEHLCVAGNHDLAAVGLVDTSAFNPLAASAVQWTSERLDHGDISYLRGLPLTAVVDGFTLAHGSPREPIWEYITSPWAASQNLKHFETPYCLVGHTHVPVIFRFKGAEESDCVAEPFPGDGLLALATERMIINPGGVGQPRDGDPRAAYAVLDIDAKTLRQFRVEYDIALTQEKMLRAGLAAPLIRRLSFGR